MNITPRNRPGWKTLRPHTHTSTAIELAEPGNARAAFDAAFNEVVERLVERRVRAWYEADDPDVSHSVIEQRIREMDPAKYESMYRDAYLQVLRLLCEPDTDDFRDSLTVVSEEQYNAFAEEIIGPWIAAGRTLPTSLTDRT